MRKYHSKEGTRRMKINEFNDKISRQKALTTGKWRSDTIVERKEVTPLIDGTRKLKVM